VKLNPCTSHIILLRLLHFGVVLIATLNKSPRVLSYNCTLSLFLQLSLTELASWHVAADTSPASLKAMLRPLRSFPSQKRISVHAPLSLEITASSSLLLAFVHAEGLLSNLQVIGRLVLQLIFLIHSCARIIEVYMLVLQEGEGFLCLGLPFGSIVSGPLVEPAPQQ
jgi:hypothetical protein